MKTLWEWKISYCLLIFSPQPSYCVNLDLTFLLEMCTSYFVFVGINHSTSIVVIIEVEVCCWHLYGLHFWVLSERERGRESKRVRRSQRFDSKCRRADWLWSLCVSLRPVLVEPSTSLSVPFSQIECVCTESQQGMNQRERMRPTQEWLDD